MNLPGPENIKLPKQIPSSLEIFSIPNMLTILPEQSLANVNAQNPIFKQYLDLINKDINDNTMLAYTDGSALKNPGLTAQGVLIKVQGHKSIQIKLAKAISSKGTSFDGELAAILMATQYALTHLTKEHDSFNIYSDCQAAICAITEISSEFFEVVDDMIGSTLID